MTNIDRIWENYVELLKPAGALAEKISGLTPQIRAEFHRQLLMNLALGYFCYFQSDAAYPEFTPFLNSVFMLQPNPDDTYYLAFLEGSGIYRISGERGSVHILAATIGRNQMGMSEEPGVQFAEFELDAMTDENGRVDLLLSAARPLGFAGHWRELHPEAEFIMIRQRSYHWGAEADARLAIERLDPLPSKPRLSEQETARRSQAVLGFAQSLSAKWLNYLLDVRSALPVNTVRMTQFAGGVRVQQYWEALFELEEGEALVLETMLPDKRPYWNVQLNDTLFNAIEFVYRQSSLNGAQAVIDSDGKFRAVIADADPGVPNWLDTMGHRTGTIIGRWYACDYAPRPTLKKIWLDALRAHLPADTPAVTGQERAASLQLRTRGAQLRRRW